MINEKPLHPNVEKMILNYLKEVKTANGTKIAKDLNVCRMTASRHLAIMEAKKLVKCEIKGMSKKWTVITNGRV